MGLAAALRPQVVAVADQFGRQLNRIGITT